MKNNLRRCTKCGGWKNATTEFFHRDTNDKSGLCSQCKKCKNEQKRQYRQGNHEKVRQSDHKYYRQNRGKCRNTQRDRRYGLIPGQYDQMFERQKGLCAICGLPEVAKQKNGVVDLSVDHNHGTGKIRGLLCAKCNTAIGSLRVDNFGPQLLYCAIKYLEKNQ